MYGVLTVLGALVTVACWLYLPNDNDAPNTPSNIYKTVSLTEVSDSSSSSSSSWDEDDPLQEHGLALTDLKDKTSTQVSQKFA